MGASSRRSASTSELVQETVMSEDEVKIDIEVDEKGVVESLKPSLIDIRTKGQVWTPRWVADAMAAYLGSNCSESLLDPAVGPGVLFVAAKEEVEKLGSLIAYEIDETVLRENSSDTTFSKTEISDLRIKDFILDESKFEVASIISNPPYLRHHKVPVEVKSKCQKIVKETLGISVDARAGLHIFFLVKALSHLKLGGKLSFLMPADTFEGVFASSLWTAISRKFRIEGVLTFDPEASAFPGVDTNASVIFIQNSEPTGYFRWFRWIGNDPSNLSSAIRSCLNRQESEAELLGLETYGMQTSKAIEIGFTRLHTSKPKNGIGLTEFATVMRGVASGSNEYFVMTKKRILDLGLREDLFVRTLSRVRDASQSIITAEFLDELDAQGRPTYLLSLDKDSRIDEALQRYLDYGEEQGVHKGSLVSLRKKWYYMEKRKPVPILFAYLGRRNNRFIDARTEITPLTGFLCVYPKEGLDKEKIISALNHPSSIQELSRIGKSYGDGAVKVEPGGLRRMIIPLEALESSNLRI